jgi:hypothetical protein
MNLLCGTETLKLFMSIYQNSKPSLVPIYFHGGVPHDRAHWLVLGAFAKLLKVAVSFAMPVCLSVRVVA